MNKRQPRKGLILPLMAVVILLLSLAGVTLGWLAQSARIRSMRNRSEIQARAAADAGIERSLFLLNQALASGAWDPTSLPTFADEPLEGTNAVYSTVIQQNGANDYSIVSTGQSGPAAKTVNTGLRLTSPFADFAVLVKDSLEFKAKAKVTGYNSGDLLDDQVYVRIGTTSIAEGSIVLKNGSEVEGDIYIGPGGDLDVISGVGLDDIEGMVIPMPREYPIPVIVPPTGLLEKGTLTGVNYTVTQTDSGRYSSLEVGTNGRLEVIGDCTLHITGNIELKNSATIDVAPGSSLDLYVDGDIDAANSGGMNNQTQIPSALKIFGTGTGQTFRMKNDSELFSVILAPEADITIDNSGDLYGSYIGKTFEMKNGGTIYYDEALGVLTTEETGVRFVVLRWEDQ